METQIKPQKERQSNLELLRILAMFLVVLVHYEAHGVKHVSDPEMNMLWRSGSAVNQFFCQLLAPGGKIGVGIFFLLTGYFLCDGKYSLRKLVKLLLTVYFYAIFAFLVLVGGGYNRTLAVRRWRRQTVACRFDLCRTSRHIGRLVVCDGVFSSVFMHPADQPMHVVPQPNAVGSFACRHMGCLVCVHHVCVSLYWITAGFFLLSVRNMA